LYLTNALGVVTDQLTFCIAVGSPDVRPNAPCLGGQTIFCQYITATLQQWIDSVLGVKLKNSAFTVDEFIKKIKGPK
jgi:hypothetical protein